MRECVCIEGNGWVHFFDRFKRVSGVKLDTAGVIPLSINSKRLGNITMYDLAGHREYYSSHAAVLEKMNMSDTCAFII